MINGNVTSTLKNDPSSLKIVSEKSIAHLFHLWVIMPVEEF